MSNISNIHSLCLVAATACNLKCEYCEIDQVKNPAAAKAVDDATMAALADGTYLTNVSHSLDNLGIGTRQIRSIDIWGQEPTLMLPNFTLRLGEWFQAFPNWDRLMFSTNALTDLSVIVDFAEKIEQLCGKTRKFSFELQFSYDGEWGTSNSRQADGDKLQTNMINLVQALNEKDFRNIHIEIFGHNVLSQKLLYKLDSMSKIRDYFNQMDKWMHPISKLATKEYLHVHPTISGTIQAPIKASTDDGIRYADFLKRVRQLGELSTCDEANQYTPGIGFLHCWDYCFEVLARNGYHTPGELFKDRRTNEVKFWQVMKDLNEGTFCGQNYAEIKIMYDGTVMPCQNYLFNMDATHIPKDGSIRNSVICSDVDPNHLIIFNALDEENCKTKGANSLELFQVVKEGSFFYMVNSLAILIKTLALSHQVDRSYLTDDEKVFSHALYLAGVYCCQYNNAVTTGSLFHKDVGFIRLYCNGAADILLEEKDNFAIRGERT